jgi:hypothetical protein
VISQFLQRYGSLDESDIPAAVKTFEALLREGFQEAKMVDKSRKTMRFTLT